MAKVVIKDDIKASLRNFLAQNEDAELVGAYLHFLELHYRLEPVLFPRDKKIYRTPNDVAQELERAGKLWHETEIVLRAGEESVNEHTVKIYICPFTGKVFGDNTHPNPQDAIYDWVSKCPENTERVNGLRVKRFYVSEDPGVIKQYIEKNRPQEPVKKKVYSSAVTGKLFNSKEAVVEDFKKNQLKRMSLLEVQGQNRYQIEDHLLTFLQTQLTEEPVAAFVEAMAEIPEFAPFVERWIGE